MFQKYKKRNKETKKDCIISSLYYSYTKLNYINSPFGRRSGKRSLTG